MYQVYPRSFNDSNGDGIGDLNGITAKLDYLKQLGIDVVWLSPHFDSPNADNGYDIRDYRQVLAEFGTMADFHRMLEAMRVRGIELIIDLVINHSSDSPAWRERSAKALATLVLTQRATPFLYQGDELGMTNYPFRSVEDYDDVEIHGQWRQLVETGQVPAAEYLDHVPQTSRDNARTPMQWSADPHGGFTTGQPWLAVNPNYVEINAAAQIDDPESVFHHHRRLIALRRQIPALVHGVYVDIDPKHEQVFAYTRTLADERYLAVLNFGANPLEYALPAGLSIERAMLDNGSGDAVTAGASQLRLGPWQATIYKLE